MNNQYLHRNLTGDIVENVKATISRMPNKKITIAHGCNCFGVNLDDIAKAIVKEWPGVLTADKQYGADLDPYDVFGDVSFYYDHNLTVANMYTQYWFGHTKENASDLRKLGYPNFFNDDILVSYDAVDSAAKKVAMLCADTTIFYPAIGSGLAKGNFAAINEILLYRWRNIETIYIEHIA